MNDSLAKSNFGSSIFSWMIFILPALALTISPGISLVEATILIGTVVCIKPLWLRRNDLFKDARWIVLAFTLQLAAVLMSVLWSGFEIYYMDYPSRLFLTVPAIGLIGLHRPKAVWFWYGLFVGTISVMCIALYQRFVLGMERAEGVHMAIMFGDIAIAMGIMSLASVKVFAKTRFAAFPYIAFLAGAIASVLSSSRGGWIVLIFSSVPLYFYYRLGVRRKLLPIALAGAAFLVMAYLIPQSEVRERLYNIVTDLQQYKLGDVNTSIGQRFEMWKAASMMFVEHPILGIGYGNFQQGLTDLIGLGKIDTSVQTYKHAHNEVMNALATQGIVGIIVLLLLYGAPLMFFMRHMHQENSHRPYALAGVLLILSYIACGLTQVLFAHHIGSAFYGATVSVLAGICTTDARNDRHLMMQAEACS
jgi:O-antigen ligase